MTDTEYSPVPGAGATDGWGRTRLVEPLAAAESRYLPRHAWHAEESGRTRFAAATVSRPEPSELERRLATLGTQWHCVPWSPAVGSARDLDQLLVGPAGVFAVMTKRHLDARLVVDGESVTIDGFEQPYVSQARAAADRIARRLSAWALFDVEVRALLVLASSGRMVVTAQPADGAVHVLTAAEVVPHLWTRPRVLGAPSIERIAAATNSAERLGPDQER